MSDGLLIGVAVGALVVLLVMQVLSARAARQLGGRSANAVIVLRAVNALAVVALIVWLVLGAVGD
ncbi:MAG: hypothetical protein ISP10_08150 [Aeromicrobium sp.]|nr:hypothetical protein [Aeromicrobium sp.]